MTETAATPATVALRRANVAFRLVRYDTTDPRASSGYGLEAAAQLGLDPDAVFKTLVVEIDGDLAVACVPVSQQLDLKALARTAGAKRASMAERAVAERATGFVLGGISPFGQRRRLPTFVDETIELIDEVHVSGGRRGLEIALAPADLVAQLDATVSAIARA